MRRAQTSASVCAVPLKWPAPRAATSSPRSVVAARGCAISAPEKYSRLSASLLRRVTLFLLAAALFVLTMPAARAQSSQSKSSGPVSVEVNPQLFATLCSLYAAGFAADSSALDTDPAFVNLFAQLRQLDGPATMALRQYYHDHALADPGATLARFEAFALVAGPPPKFTIVSPREELPPDVLTLDGFSEILANFYQEAQIEQHWAQLQPVYERLAQPLNQPLASVVFTETSYLRELLRPGPRKFTVYAEPLVGTRTNFRNIGNEYVVVANPSLDSSDEIRHAFLHFLLDPLPLRYADKLVGQSPLLQTAGRAPRLPAELRNDWAAFYAECLVRAAELRLQRLPPEKLAAEMNSADADGYVLVRPLVSALTKFEASEPAISLYFPDLARSIDISKEMDRLKTIAFKPASDLAEDSAPGTSAASTSATNLDPELEGSLVEGERFIAAHQAPAAAAAFQRVLDKVPGQPRALYGLAVASVLQGDAVHAQDLFEQVVAAAPSDANALAWSHVYLGRLYDLMDNRDDALPEYNAALAVAGAPEAARIAAQRGIDQQYRPAGHDPAPQ